MAIKIVGKCSNCGADVKFDEFQEKGFCQYCGSEFIVDKGKQSFSEQAFSYLNKASIRKQQCLKIKTESAERQQQQMLEYMQMENERAEAERKRNLKSVCIIMAVLFTLMFLMVVYNDYREDKKAAREKNNVQEQLTVSEEPLPIDTEKEEETIVNQSETVVEETIGSEEMIKRESIRGFLSNTNSQVKIGLYEFSVPDYYDADIVENDHYRAYAETGEKTVMFLASVSENSDPVSIEWFKDDKNCKEYTDSFLSSIENAELERGSIYHVGAMDGYLIKFTFDMKGVQGVGYQFIFPSEEDNSWVSAGLMESNQAGYEYYDDYSKILGSFKPIINENETTVETNSAPVEEKKEMIPTYDKKYAFRAFKAAMTNAFAYDIFTSDGSTIDKKKLHSYSDTSCEFYFKTVSEGTWTAVDENTWKGYNISLTPNYGNAKIKGASCQVTFDGTNYIVFDLSGYLAIPGNESYGTKLSSFESYSNKEDFLTVAPSLVK